MFYNNSPLTDGAPWLILDIQLVMARDGKERKNVREGLEERKGSLSPSPKLPPHPFPSFFLFALPHDLNVWNRPVNPP